MILKIVLLIEVVIKLLKIIVGLIKKTHK